ncbi:1-phosphofructokinase [Okibacterium sp. HSC-33S16]|uniref:1-phosphofructokinase family hexose kinase n=1 Tax=Okibacterium sp. HSC-33S16 TaxID=2910965 RepID=UPI0020A0714D|nr:hexose kinase [Okibacterium sp. HSC-33S16]MCP2030118.1 1-phosphofructokinase [Okibacterium sp. HSC-33S16]
MIVVVTPNPAIDITLTVDRLEPGHTHRVTPGVHRAGGKGINVARVLTIMGADAVAIAPVGSSDRAWFAADLNGIPVDFLDVPGSVRQSTAVVEPHQTTVFNETGTALDDAVWEELLVRVAARLDSADCLVISGSVPPGCSPALYGNLVALGRDREIPVVADATGSALRFAAEAGATVLKPNAAELTETTGETDPVAGARALQARGAGLILVSLGEDGMIAVPRDQRDPLWSAHLGRVLSGNPTGAGDAAVAAIASALATGTTPVDTRTLLSRATAWSAAAVLEPLAGSVHPTRVAELEAELEITVTPREDLS